MFSRYQWGKAVILAAFFFCATMANAWAADWVFPGTNMALQDGDIILSSDGSVSSEFIREFGRPTGNYGHAAVFMILPDQNPQLVHVRWDGIEFTPPQKFFRPATSTYALVRLRQPVPHEKLRQALAELQSRHLHFDYTMRWPKIDSVTTYCVGFVSQLYRLSGLPDPFPMPDHPQHELWDHQVQMIFDIDLTQTISPNAALHQSEFKTVAQYAFKSKANTLNALIRSEIVQQVKGYFLEGRFPKTNGLGDLIYLNLDALEQTFDDIPLAGLPGEFKKSFLSINEFSLQIQKRIVRTMSFEPDHNWNPDEIAGMVREIADGYRDDFFTQPNP